VRWKLWAHDCCPSGLSETKDTNHLFKCQKPGQQDYLIQQLQQLEQNLIVQKIPPLVVTVMMEVFFPFWQQSHANIPVPTVLSQMQTMLNNQKWGLPSCHWQSYLEQFNVDSPRGFITHRWLTTFIAQLWNTAWDLWQYHNGIVHHQQASVSYAKLCNDIQQEYMKGYTFLPPKAHHWIQTPLHQLLQNPCPIFLLGLLQ